MGHFGSEGQDIVIEIQCYSRVNSSSRTKTARNPRLTYGSKLYVKWLETVGSRYQHSAVDILEYDQNVRTGGYSKPLSPLGAVFKKKKKKKIPVDRQREQEAYRWGEG